MASQAANHANPLGAPKPRRRRMAVRDISAVLAVLTCLMIALGFTAVRYVVHGTRTPTLRITPSPPPNPAPEMPTTPTVKPFVLQPQGGNLDDAAGGVSPDEWPGSSPIPVEPSTASRPGPTSYR